MHVNRADSGGNGQFLGPDPYFDDLFTMAAKRSILSAEKIEPTKELLSEGSFHTLLVNRMYVDQVVEAPSGAHFTTCEPDYGRDEAFQRQYVAAAKDPDAWAAFASTYLSTDEAGYHAAVARFHAEQDKS